MSGLCYVLQYESGGIELFQYEATEDEAVEAALEGISVDNKPIVDPTGKPYPIRSQDAAERRAQREAEIRARLRQPVEQTP